jgi:16S rRNA G966 N2-methylase RsmD
MEKDTKALKILKENINSLDPSKCEVYGGDSFTNIKQITNYLNNQNKEAYFYIDPPFNFREGFESIYDDTIKLIEELPKEVVKLITLEHMTGLELPQTIGNYQKIKSKKFGKTSLTYYDKVE